MTSATPWPTPTQRAARPYGCPPGQRWTGRGDQPGALSTRCMEQRNLTRYDKGRAIATYCWDYDFDGGDNLVEVYMGRLRRKLMAAGSADPFVTVRGAGYRLEAEKVRQWLRGTRAKLTLTHAAVLAGAILLADVGLYFALATAEANTDDTVLRTQASTIVAGIEDVNGQVRFGGGDLPTENQQGVAVDAAIVSRNGSIIQTPAQVFSAATLTQLAGQALKNRSPMLVDARDRSGVERRVFVETVQGQGGPDGVLVVSRSIAESNAALGRTVLFLAVFSLLIVLGGSFLAHWLTGRVLLPVRRIAALARSVSQADLHRRVNVKVPPDELGELVETFNGMLARLEASFESLDDLPRTPLTSCAVR